MYTGKELFSTSAEEKKWYWVWWNEKCAFLVGWNYFFLGSMVVQLTATAANNIQLKFWLDKIDVPYFSEYQITASTKL